MKNPWKVSMRTEFIHFNLSYVHDNDGDDGILCALSLCERDLFAEISMLEAYVPAHRVAGNIKIFSFDI